ncbi:MULTISPECIES: HAD-IA family hydrolase [unclassified Streptococcus]|uniref:HAD family hydrolase n=1 Tax=unclassified Streptococcus TaxID=2608887 RepID=UPI00066FC952|nr:MULTISPECIES: HAD-IA family hydrolase [unclassified Streptococcus]
MFYQKLESISRQGGEPIAEAWDYFAAKIVERPLWSHEEEKLYPDTIPVLRTLQKSYSLGIIANQGPNLENRLIELGIRHYFQVVVGSSDVGMKKPEIDIFVYALKQAGISFEKATYIGGRVDNDIVPAKQLGMGAIRMLQGLGALDPENEEYPSDIKVGKLSDLLTIFNYEKPSQIVLHPKS